MIESYYQPQDNGEYMYIQYDNDVSLGNPITGPEYFDTLGELEKRHANNKIESTLQLLPQAERL